MIFAKLKLWKEEANLTYKDIGERADVPTATVQKIFSGETSNPNSETLYRICKALGHTMEELYDGKKAVDKEEFLSVTLIREMYENRIAELKDQHAKHIEDIKEAAALGVIKGVTTNPSLMAKEGIYYGLVMAQREMTKMN